MVQYILASTGFGQLILNKETHISSKSSKHVPLTDNTTLTFLKKICSKTFNWWRLLKLYIICDVFTLPEISYRQFKYKNAPSVELETYTRMINRCYNLWYQPKRSLEKCMIPSSDFSIDQRGTWHSRPLMYSSGMNSSGKYKYLMQKERNTMIKRRGFPDK